MAEEKYIEFDAKNTNTGQDVVIFSTTGEGRTEQEFHKVMDAYNKSNGHRLPASFTVLPKGEFLQRARSAYEGANQPMQEAIASGGRSVGKIAASPVTGAAWLAEKLGLLSPGASTAVSNKGADIGESVSDVFGAPFRTPEAAGGTAGGIGGALLTKRMGIPSQMAGIGAGTLLGLQGSRQLFGGPQSVEKFGMDFVEAGLAAATRGALGGYQHMFGKSMSQQGQAGVAKEIGDLVEGSLKPIMHDPAAMTAHFNTPEGLAQLSQLGIKHFMKDMDDLTNNIIRAVNTRPPATLSRSSASQLRVLSEDLFDAGQVYMNSIGDEGKMKAARSSLARIHAQMQDVLRSQYSNANQKKGLADVIADLDSSMQQHRDYLSKFADTAEFMNMMKRSTNKDGGFDAKILMDNMKTVYQENPGSLMHAAGRILQRGGSPLTEGVDRKLFSGNIPLPKPSFIPGGPWKLPLGPMGQHYTGTVQSPTAAILSAVAGRAAAEKSGIQGDER